MEKEKKKSFLDELYELYANPEGVDVVKLAEESSNQFKKAILKK